MILDLGIRLRLAVLKAGCELKDYLYFGGVQSSSCFSFSIMGQYFPPESALSPRRSKGTRVGVARLDTKWG